MIYHFVDNSFMWSFIKVNLIKKGKLSITRSDLTLLRLSTFATLRDKFFQVVKIWKNNLLNINYKTKGILKSRIPLYFTIV